LICFNKEKKKTGFNLNKQLYSYQLEFHFLQFDWYFILPGAADQLMQTPLIFIILPYFHPVIMGWRESENNADMQYIV